MYSTRTAIGRLRRLRASLGLLVGLGLAAFMLPSVAEVPNPAVTGPIPVNVPLGDPSRDYPQLATLFDLPANDYVEEEYFFEGQANEYNVVAAPLANATVRSTRHPYKTRMIVRRPVSADRFNGVVIVEWVNVTSGYNLDALWLLSRDHLMRNGYAYVGVSAQFVGVQGGPVSLKSWSPVRYASLDVTAGGRFTLLNNGGPGARDALSFDIMAQAGQAIKNPQGVDPLGGLPGARTIFASGVSQSANFLTTYYNSVHAIDPIYDGFYLYLGVSGAAYGNFRLPLRTDLPTKLFKINTENDVLLLGEHMIRQPDSDVLRTWEIAGTSHVGFDPQQVRTQLLIRDGIPLTPATGCVNPPLSHVPTFKVLNAAFDHMVRWVRNDVPPPTAPRIQLTTPSPVPPPPPIDFPRIPAEAVRTADGNALGGIQVSQHAVPTATNTGLNSGPGFCVLFGSHVPFTAEHLVELYPTHGSYVSKVVKVTNDHVKVGYILPFDAEIDKAAAAESSIGK